MTYQPIELTCISEFRPENTGVPAVLHWRYFGGTRCRSRARDSIQRNQTARRGATLAVHSTLGYAGGFIGPLAVGWTLDLSGGMSPAAWAMAFSMIAALTLIALANFWAMRPRELAGDRYHST